MTRICYLVTPGVFERKEKDNCKETSLCQAFPWEWKLAHTVNRNQTPGQLVSFATEKPVPISCSFRDKDESTKSIPAPQVFAAPPGSLYYLNQPQPLFQDNETTKQWRSQLQQSDKKAISSTFGKQVYLQGAILKEAEIVKIDSNAACWDCFKQIPDGNSILDLKQKLVILSDQDCAALVETGLQREVRIALKEDEKVVFGGSFRSEEAIPSETVLFLPWGIKPDKDENKLAIELAREWSAPSPAETLRERVRQKSLIQKSKVILGCTNFR